jgi:hypothetical protein
MAVNQSKGSNADVNLSPKPSLRQRLFSSGSRKAAGAAQSPSKQQAETHTSPTAASAHPVDHSTSTTSSKFISSLSPNPISSSNYCSQKKKAHWLLGSSSSNHKPRQQLQLIPHRQICLLGQSTTRPTGNKGPSTPHSTQKTDASLFTVARPWSQHHQTPHSPKRRKAMPPLHLAHLHLATSRHSSAESSKRSCPASILTQNS